LSSSVSTQAALEPIGSFEPQVASGEKAEKFAVPPGGSRQ
jgi:hypothetical protein